VVYITVIQFENSKSELKMMWSHNPVEDLDLCEFDISVKYTANLIYTFTFDEDSGDCTILVM